MCKVKIKVVPNELRVYFDVDYGRFYPQVFKDNTWVKIKVNGHFVSYDSYNKAREWIESRFEGASINIGGGD